MSIAVLHGEHKDLADERDEDDGRASPPPAGDQPGPAAAGRTRVYTIGPPLPPVLYIVLYTCTPVHNLLFLFKLAKNE